MIGADGQPQNVALPPGGGMPELFHAALNQVSGVKRN